MRPVVPNLRTRASDENRAHGLSRVREIRTFLLYEVDLSALGVGHLPVLGHRAQRVLVRGVAGVCVCVLRALRG